MKEIKMVHSTAQATDTILALDIAGDPKRILLQQWHKDIVKGGTGGGNLELLCFSEFYSQC